MTLALDMSTINSINLKVIDRLSIQWESHCPIIIESVGLQSVFQWDGWLFGCVLRPIYSEVIWRRHPLLLSVAKDVKLGIYTVPIGNRTPGRRVAVHYATAVPHKLHTQWDEIC